MDIELEEYFVLVKIDYNVYLAVPYSDINVLSKIRIVEENESESAYQDKELGKESLIVPASKLSKEAVEEGRKLEIDKYRRWWLDEQKKTATLQMELNGIKLKTTTEER